MGRKSITIRDVADKANVSIATVSRVLNGHTVAGNSTCQKVLRAARQVGYIAADPNQKPRNNEKTVFAIIHDKNIAYMEQVVKGAHEAAKKLGFNIVVHIVRDSQITANAFLKAAKNTAACGMLFVSACVPTSVMSTLEASIPVVKCIDVLDNDNVTCIGINERESFRSLTSYLVSTGRKKIALVRSPLMGNIVTYRESGFLEVMRANNLPVNFEWITPNIKRNGEVIDFNHVLYHVRTLVNGANRPDAIMCNIDTDAAMVLKAVLSLGLRVPEDIAITGYYNLPASQLVTPELTTVETFPTDIGYSAMQMLAERIADPHLPHTKLYTPAEVIVRKSTTVF